MKERSVKRSASTADVRAALRPQVAPPALPNDEHLLNATYSTLHLQWRCDLALWYALYDEALRQVARVSAARDRKIRAYAEHVLAHGDAEARSYWDIRASHERRLEVRPGELPTTFTIGIVTGTYPDERFACARFDLRRQRGIAVRYEHLAGEAPSRTVPMPARPDSADAIAARTIRHALSAIDAIMPCIPRPEDLTHEAFGPDEETLEATEREMDERAQARLVPRDPEHDRAVRQQAARRGAENSHSPKRARRIKAGQILRGEIPAAGARKR